MLQRKAKWVFSETEADHARPSTPATISPYIAELLAQRGMTQSEDIEAFLSPDLSNLNSPAFLHSIDQAVNRVHEAITHHEKILIFGDYDADGVSSTTLMLHALSELGADCDYYIPNRFTEGYGPNEQAFKWAHENDVKLIITVDTGIAAVDEIHYANSLGIDVILTDHHEIQHDLPDAYAILHPKCSPDYPFKELAGVGVAFKFAEALLGYFPKHLLDLTALGTIADMVPLIDENRILAYYGLKEIQTTPRPGLIALKKVYQIEGAVSEEAIGFQLAPALNAVGRLQEADLAVDLLLAQTEAEAIVLAEEVKALNEQRKSIVKQIVQEAEAKTDPDEQGVIVVAHPGWNAGVLGIVASRLVRKFNRPAIVLTIDEDGQTAKGSARSIPAFDIFKNGMEVRALFTHFGGHSQAAGMTLPAENIDVLHEKLNTLIKGQLSDDDFKPVINVSLSLDVADIDEQMVLDVAKLAPFGMQNPKPVFHIQAVPSDVRQIGSSHNHLKMQFQKDGKRLDVVGFGMGAQYHSISLKTPVSVVGELGINEWNGHRKVQLLMQDLGIDTWQLFDRRGRHDGPVVPQLHEDSQVAVVGNTPEDEHEQVVQIQYGENVSTQPNIDILIIKDLPPALEALAHIVKQTQPKQIHACYHVQDSAYLKAFPSREDFKWFYALIHKRTILDLHQELKPLMAAKSWSKDQVIFMAQVFRELEFVHINKGVIRKNPQPVKKDLQDSAIYQSRLNNSEIEKVLYYSQNEELKAWFADCMEDGQTAREVVSDGLQTTY